MPAVIGHSCCGVPANVLSVCLFFAKLINKITVISGFPHKTVQRLQKYFGGLPPAHPIDCNSGKVWRQTFNVRSLWSGGKELGTCEKEKKIAHRLS